MHHPAEPAAGPRAGIDHRRHGRSGSGKPTHDSGHHIADALPDQFLVAVMAGLADIVHDDRGQ